MDYKMTTEGDVNFSDARLEWIKKRHGFETFKMLKKDEELFIHQSLSTPCLDVLEECCGSYICSIDGKKYLDFHGNNSHNIGFRNQFVIDKIKKQMDIMPFCTRRYTNEPALKLAQKLIDKAPSDFNKVLFSPSGAVMNSTALKIARLYTKKHKVISLWGSFHGATLDTISIGGERLFRKNLGPMFTGVKHVPPPIITKGALGKNADIDDYLNYVEYVVNHESDIGAMIIEPVRNTDVTIMGERYLNGIRGICNKNNIVLIFDEIAIGLGRCGSFYAFERFNVEPDILTLGKGLGGGIIPMAALVTKDKFNIAKHTALGHYTHEKSPIGCTAGIAVIEYIEKENLLEKVMQNEKIFLENLSKLASDYYNLIEDVRGIGMLWGIELKSKDIQVFINKAEKIMYSCLNKGLSFKVSDGNVLTLTPPLTITQDEMETSFQILRAALSEV